VWAAQHGWVNDGRSATQSVSNSGVWATHKRGEIWLQQLSASAALQIVECLRHLRKRGGLMLPKKYCRSELPGILRIRHEHQVIARAVTCECDASRREATPRASLLRLLDDVRRASSCALAIRGVEHRVDEPAVVCGVDLSAI